MRLCWLAESSQVAPASVSKPRVPVVALIINGELMQAFNSATLPFLWLVSPSVFGCGVSGISCQINAREISFQCFDWLTTYHCFVWLLRQAIMQPTLA